MSRLSIVIPFYGNPSETLILIDLIKNQLQQEEVQIIVSDDSSPVAFPHVDGVEVIRRDFNGGFGANVNTGVSVAIGDWLIILNSDLTLPSYFFERMLAAATEEVDKSGKKGVMLSPQIVGHSGESQWVGRDFPKTRHHVWEWLTPLARLRHTKFWHSMVGHDLSCVTDNRAEPDWLMGACMMLRRKDFLAVGGMDERFFMNSEEVDLQRRLAENGIKRIFRGDIIVEHVGGGSSGASQQRRQWVLDSRFIYNAKWKEGKYLSSLLRLASYANFIFNYLRSIYNKSVNPKASLLEELAFIKKAERKR